MEVVGVGGNEVTWRGPGVVRDVGWRVSAGDRRPGER